MQDSTEQLKTLYKQLVNGPSAVLPDTDQAFGQLWQTCNNPVLLLHLASRLLSRESLVQATVCCVRLLAASRLAALPEGLAALDWAEKWALGQASEDQVMAAAALVLAEIEQEETAAVQSADPEMSEQTDQRTDLAYAGISVTNLVRYGDFNEDLDKAVGYALKNAWWNTNPEQAEVLRDLLPCPTLAQLCSVYGYASLAPRSDSDTPRT